MVVMADLLVRISHSLGSIGLEAREWSLSLARFVVSYMSFLKIYEDLFNKCLATIQRAIYNICRSNPRAY